MDRAEGGGGLQGGKPGRRVNDPVLREGATEGSQVARLRAGDLWLGGRGSVGT